MAMSHRGQYRSNTYVYDRTSVTGPRRRNRRHPARWARWRLRYLEEDPTATRANSRPRRPRHLTHSKILRQLGSVTHRFLYVASTAAAVIVASSAVRGKSSTEGETCQPTGDGERPRGREPPSQPEQRLSKTGLSRKLRSGSSNGSVWATVTGFLRGFKDSLIRQLTRWPRVHSRSASFEKWRPSRGEWVGSGMVVTEQKRSRATLRWGCSRKPNT
jgi:hypothetical protein